VLRNEILQLMEALKLSGMRSVYDELTASATKTHASSERTIHDLLEAEAAERRLRAIRYQMGQAKFPRTSDLDGFDFKSSPAEEREIRSLYEGMISILSIGPL
jgi:DNA replication protein DnaC